VEAAVEAEVARRLAERVKQQHEEETAMAERSKADTIPAGVLTPLLKRHKDLDKELMARLQELERK
jgi:kinesin family protein 22